MTLKEIAEQKADNYVKYALGDAPNQDEAFAAREDFAAGFVSGFELNHRTLEFCKQQLKFIVHNCEESGDLNTVALLRYVLERIK